MKDIFVVIPTYDPNETIMEEFVSKLQKEFKNIIIINDGCRVEYDAFFEKFQTKKIKVLKKNVNLGKGMALKYAYNYILNKYPKCKGVVSADCDGQHTVEDIKKIAESVLENPDSLILGVRDFSLSSVPKRSKVANTVTKFVMEEMLDLYVSDTQSGLRGMSYELLKTLIKTTGERYEYEARELMDCKEKSIPIIEVPIETIYIDGNSESHFNIVGDTLKVYSLFAKYFGRLALVLLLNVIIFRILLKIMILPDIVTVTLSIIAANLICMNLYKYKKEDIVTTIVYITSLVILTLIFGGITNISYTICYIICMLLSYILIKLVFE